MQDQVFKFGTGNSKKRGAPGYKTVPGEALWLALLTTLRTSRQCARQYARWGLAVTVSPVTSSFRSEYNGIFSAPISSFSRKQAG